MGIKQKLLSFERRKKRVRKKILGTPSRPRLSIRRSHKNLSAQLIDDLSGKTIIGLSTLDKRFVEKSPYGGNIKAAKLFGEFFAAFAVEKGIKKIVFDRGGYKYHGRIKAFAQALRDNGLLF
jgi:large subunit ribosomal protein L18